MCCGCLKVYLVVPGEHMKGYLKISLLSNLHSSHPCIKSLHSGYIQAALQHRSTHNTERHGILHSDAPACGASHHRGILANFTWNIWLPITSPAPTSKVSGSVASDFSTICTTPHGGTDKDGTSKMPQHGLSGLSNNMDQLAVEVLRCCCTACRNADCTLDVSWLHSSH